VIVPVTIPAIPQKLLAQLTDMGFPEKRAKKALLLNRMDPDASVEWLFEHMDDADIDSPLNKEQIALLATLYPQPPPSQLIRFVQPQPQQPQQQQRQINPLVEQAIANNVCTYSCTGPQYAVQEWFQCFTCNLAGNQGCCSVCARICHAGHQVVGPLNSNGFFCDCGAGESGKPCKAMKNNPPNDGNNNDGENNNTQQ